MADAADLKSSLRLPIITDDIFAKIIKGVDVTRIRVCDICRTIFWAGRYDSLAAHPTVRTNVVSDNTGCGIKRDLLMRLKRNHKNLSGWLSMLRSRLAKTYLCFGNHYKLIFKPVGITFKQPPKDLNLISRTLILKSH